MKLETVLEALVKCENMKQMNTAFGSKEYYRLDNLGAMLRKQIEAKVNREKINAYSEGWQDGEAWVYDSSWDQTYPK